MTEIFKITDDSALEKVSVIIKNGGVVAVPTDTVYGLGAKFDDQEAIARIFKLKGRAKEKALVVLIGELSQLERLQVKPTGIALKLMEKFWPGPLTIVLKKEGGDENESIGLRFPDHDFLCHLINLVGPMAVTSANISGKPPALNIEEVLNYFPNELDLIIDGGKSKTNMVSTVIDCISEIPKILRHSAISEEDMMKTLINWG